MMPQKDSSATTSQTPHVKIASITLPPDVKGDPKGELVVSINSLRWHYRRPPQQVQARIKWWGGAADTVVPFHSTRGAGAAFPIKCGPRYLARYLKDMGSLVVGVEECPTGRSVGAISIAVSQLDVGKPIEAKVPCHGTHEQVLATADVSMRIHYTQMMSSFEINEHLASTDKQLPLYPVPDVQGAKSRQQLAATVQGRKAAMLEAAVKEIAAVDNHENSLNRSPAGHNAVSQQEPISGMAADGSAAVAAPSAATAMNTPQKQQQYSEALVAVCTAAAHETAAATAKADPLLDVIRKAEQLKVAMQQAASRGISLGLPNGLAGHPGVLAGPQPLPQQQTYLQMLLPNLQQQRLQTPWLHDVAYLGFHAAGVNSPVPAMPSTVALEAVRSCLYGPTGSTASTLALPPPPAQSTAVANGGASVGDSEAGASVQRHLSPLAAALLQMPHPVQDDDASSDAEVGSTSNSTLGDSNSQLTELEDLEELEELLLQELFRVRDSPKSSPVKKRGSTPQPPHQQQDQPVATTAEPGPSTAESNSKTGEQSAGHQATSSAATSSISHQATQQQSPCARPATAEKAASAPAGPKLLVVLTAIEGVGSPAGQPPAALTAVIKTAGLNTAIDLTKLLSHFNNCSMGTGTGSDPGGVTAVVTGPSCLSRPALATDRPCLAVEIWSGKPADPAAAMVKGAGELLGIVKVPLQLTSASAAGLEPPPCLASGTYPVYDVLRGRYAGSLGIQVSPAAEAEAPAADQVEGEPVAAADEAAAPAAVLAVRHVIEVTIHSASVLPAEQQLEVGGQAVPESRFLKYSFPGEEPLYTQEVDVVAAPVFSAHAQHTVLLPPGTTVAECLLAGEGEEPECLAFELFDKWQDDSDTLLASGALPLQQVLALGQINHPGTSESSSCMRTFLVQLQLAAGTGEAAVQPPDQAVLLQVTVSYTASNCYTLDGDSVNATDGTGLLEDEADEGDDSSKQPVAVAGTAAVGGGQAITRNSGPDRPQGSAGLGHEAPTSAVQSGSPTAVASDIRQQQHVVLCGQEDIDTYRSDGGAAVEEASWPQQQQQQQYKGPGVYETAVLEDDQVRHEGDMGSVDLHVAAVRQSVRQDDQAGMLDQQHDFHTSPHQQQQPLTEDQPAAAAATLQHSSQQQPEQQMLSAEVCVEVIRACGLQAAVIEAERCLGGSSSLLGRARHLGPHPFVTIDLLPLSSGSSSSSSSSTKTLPRVKTPFQAQTFCPQFHYKQIIPLMLDSNTLTDLACQYSNIELWHHCPRSQAVAAALSRGHSSSFVMGGQQQVLLGVARLPLQGLLVKPQGIRCWVVLKSPQGVAVGAVQVALYLTHIGGQAVQQCPAADSPIARYPQLLQLLPQAPASQLGPLITGAPPGFTAQTAAVSVHIQELLLPGGDDLLLERPKIANYVATYRLPGRERAESTHSKANSSQRTSGSLLSQSWHVDWQYCGRHWVTADWRLARALTCYPLHITVAKQEPSRRSSSSSGGRADQQQQLQQPVMVPMGSVEVDLAALLSVRSGAQRPSCRWLSGVYAVVHPMAKNLGNIQLRLKVLLELLPAEAPAADAAKGTAAYWEISGPLAAVSAPALPPKAAAAVASAAAVNIEQQLPTPNTSDQQQQLLHPVGDLLDVQCKAETDAVLIHHLSFLLAAPAPQTQETLDGSSPSAGDAGVVIQATPVAAGSQGEAAKLEAAAAAADVQTELTAAGSRLRAEVSHVSAPASIAVSRSISPIPEPVQQQQQQQPTVVPPSAAVLTQQQQQQQEISSPLNMSAQRHQQQQQQGLNDVRVCVEAALNLELPHLAPGSTACLYVQYYWQQTHSVIATPLVAAAVGPLGHSASAKWFHCVHLPLAPGDRTAAAAANGGEAPQLLMLQVWLRPLAATSAAALPPLYAGVAAAPAAGDVLLGCAELDLAALQMLGAIEGWYNISDDQQQMKGQVKVNLTPVQQHTAVSPSSEPIPRQQHQAEGLWSAAPSTGNAHGMAQAAPNEAAEKAPQSAASSYSCSNSSIAAVRAADGVQAAGLGGEKSVKDAAVLQQQEKVDYTPLQAADAGSSQSPWPEPATKAAQVQADLWQSSVEPFHGLPCLLETGLSDTDDAHGTDQLLESLRANLKELDEISAALSERVKPVTSSHLEQEGSQDAEHPSSRQQDQQQQDAAEEAPSQLNTGQQQDHQQREHQQTSHHSLNKYRGQQQQNQQQQQAGFRAPVSNSTAPPAAQLDSSISRDSTCQAGTAAPALMSQASPQQAAAAAASFRHVQTLSDDEDYFVSGAAVTDSDTDTVELMGRVDWSMANNSDDYDVPPGPPAASRAAAPASQLSSASANNTAPPPAAAAAGSSKGFTPEPLNKEDWMFDFSRPSALTTAGAGSSSGSSGPVNPAQLSQAEAAAQQAAASERLLRLDAANAAAAAARAAAAERAAVHAAADKAVADGCTANKHRKQQDSSPAGNDAAEVSHATTAAAGSSDAVWDQLAAVEEQEERQQQQQQQRQQQAHDPRDLPEDLNERLDLLLAGFQAAVNPRPPHAAAAAAQAAGPVAADRASQGLQHVNHDDDDDDGGGDFLPAERVVHLPGADRVTSSVGFANFLPPIQDDFVLEYSDGPRRLTAAAVEHTPAAAAAAAIQCRQATSAAAAAAAWDREDDDPLDESLFLPAERVNLGSSRSSRGGHVRFSNSLPPAQDDFDMQYTEEPARSRSDSSRRQQQQQRPPLNATLPSPAAVPAGHPGMHPAAAAAAAAAVEAASVSEAAGAAGGSNGSSSRNVGMVPVLGGYSAAAMDDMFSISKRSRTNSSNSSIGRSQQSGPPIVTVSNTTAAVPGTAAQHGAGSSRNAQQQQQQQQQPPLCDQSGSAQPATAAAVAVATAGSSIPAVPVLGRHTAAGLDDMFSFRNGGSSNNGSSAMSKASSSGIKHPYM